MAEHVVYSASDLDDADWDYLEQCVSRFEQSWRTGDPPSVADYLPPCEHALRRTVLIELVKIDLEYRWESGETPTVETYLERWPDLTSDSEALENLLRNECRIRMIVGRSPSENELERRFPDLWQRIDLQALEDQSRQDRLVRPEVVDTGSDALATARPGEGAHAASDHPLSLCAGQPFGRYQIHALLGQGNMANVYRAYDARLEREVAIKVPHLAEPAVVEQFLREARAAAQIRHPNICPIHDVDRLDGTYYMAMSLIEGQPLSQLIQHAPLDPRRAVTLAAKLARALAEVHAHDLVHRDIKASNIMIDMSGEPILMDFGLAWQTAMPASPIRRDVPSDLAASARQASTAAPVASASSIIGTPAYLSPEQVAGHAADATSDIYSLGVVFFQMLTGRLPFLGPVREVLEGIASGDPPAPRSLRPELPPAAESICLKAMAKDPSERYQSATELAEALESRLQAASSAVSRPSRYRRWQAAGLLAAAAALGGVYLFFSTGSGVASIVQNDPKLQVRIDGHRVNVTSEAATRVTVDVGTHEVEILQGDEVVDAWTVVIRWRGSEVEVPLGDRLPEAPTVLQLDNAPEIPVAQWIETRAAADGAAAADPCGIALSPDGKTLYAATTNRSSGDEPIRVFDVASGEEWKDRAIEFVKETGRTDQFYHGIPVISPDGKHLFVSHYLRNYLTRVELATNVASRMQLPADTKQNSFAQIPAISPDGKRLVINVGGDGRRDDEQNDYVAVANIANGEFSLIDEVRLDNEMTAQRASFSADSQFAYFVTLPRKSNTWELCELSMHHPCTVTRRLSFPYARLSFTVVWNERARILVSDAAGQRLWVVDQKTFQIVTYLDMQGYAPGAAVLVDNEGVLLVSCGSNRSLFLIDLARETVLGRVSGLRDGSGSPVFDAVSRRLFISHNETRGGIAVVEVPRRQPSIVFASRRGGDNYELWMMNADGTDLAQLTKNHATDVSPRWSPDGRTVAFLSDRSGSARIVLLRLSDRSESVLDERIVHDSPPPDGSNAASFDWSADGREIVAICDEGRSLRIVDAATHQGRTLRAEPPMLSDGMFEQVRWDRTSKNIVVYVRSVRNSMRRELVCVDPKTNEWTQITRTIDEPYTYSGTSVSPDGTAIAVLRLESKETDSPNCPLWRLNRDGTPLGAVPGPPLRENLFPVWMPDGTGLMFPSRTDGFFHLYLVPVAGGTPIQLTHGDWHDIDPDVWDYAATIHPRPTQ